MFLKRDLSHVLALDPNDLALTRDEMCWFGPAPTTALTSRKVWGERCSGTNFTDSLLKRHFPALSRKRGRLEWKHGLARPNWSGAGRLNVFVVRDPFTWAQSFYRNPWHLPVRLRDRDFSAFIREEWVGVFYDQGKNTPERPADRHPVEQRRFRDIWEMRSVKLRHALVSAAAIPNGVFARYEDISTDPERLIREIASRFDLSAVAYQPISDYKGEAERAYSATRYETISAEDRAYISSRLDPDLEGFFGYAADP